MRTTTLLTSGFVSLALAVPVQLRAQADSTDRTPVAPEKAEAIRTLLELTKAADAFILGFEEAMADQATVADLPDGFLEAFDAKVRKRTPEFIELLIPLYDKHLSTADVTELIEFFRTPLGKRYVEFQMASVPEMGTLGERWGMKLVGEVFMELSKEP